MPYYTNPLYEGNEPKLCRGREGRGVLIDAWEYTSGREAEELRKKGLIWDDVAEELEGSEDNWWWVERSINNESLL